MTRQLTGAALFLTFLMGCPENPGDEASDVDGSTDEDADSSPDDNGKERQDSGVPIVCPPVDAGRTGDDAGVDASADDGGAEEEAWWDPELVTVTTPLAGVCSLTAGRYIVGAADTNYVSIPGKRKPGTCTLASLYEPNEVADNACSIVLGERINSELSGGTDLTDYYTAQVKQGRTYTLALTRSMNLSRIVTMPVGADSVTYLPSATLISAGTSAETFTADRDGAVLIRLSGGDVYSMQLLPSTEYGLLHDNLTFEPNDTESTAAPVCVGSPISSEVIGSDDRFDYYQAQLNAEVTYTLRLIRSGNLQRTVTMNSGGQLRTVVPYGTLIATGTSFEDFVPPVSGLATLVLSGALYEATILPGTDFGLTHDPISFEPNDSVNLAKPLALGQAISSEFASSHDIADVYRFDVEQGQGYTLDLTRTGNLTRSAFLVRDGQQVTALAQAQQISTGSSHEAFVAPASGVLNVRVAGGVGQTYSLQLSKQ